MSASLRWLLDECVSAELVMNLRTAGHDVAYVCETARGSSDAEVIAQAQAEGRILLTEDKDFGELIYRRRQPVPGLILLRIEPEMPALRWVRLRAAIDQFGEALFGRYTVIEENRFRWRALLRLVPKTPE